MMEVVIDKGLRDLYYSKSVGNKKVGNWVVLSGFLQVLDGFERFFAGF
jgi:hypothetical protein